VTAGPSRSAPPWGEEGAGRAEGPRLRSSPSHGARWSHVTTEVTCNYRLWRYLPSQVATGRRVTWYDGVDGSGKSGDARDAPARHARREVERRTRKQTNPHFVSENREKTILETGDTQRGDTTRDWRAASRLITRSSQGPWKASSRAWKISMVALVMAALAPQTLEREHPQVELQGPFG